MKKRSNWFVVLGLIAAMSLVYSLRRPSAAGDIASMKSHGEASIQKENKTPGAAATPPDQLANPEGPATVTGLNATNSQESPVLVAYYFYTTARCYTCKLIESLSSHSIRKNFADELASGRMTWQTVNVQEPANRHYIQRYQLFTKSVVIARMDNGHELRHKVLNDTWNLVSDQIAFENYIVGEIHSMLGNS